MDSRFFDDFSKAKYIRVNKRCYKVKEMSPEGILKADLLDIKGELAPYSKPEEFDLNRLAVYEISVIGIQPGWSVLTS